MKFGFPILHHAGAIAVLLSIGSGSAVLAGDGRAIEFSGASGTNAFFSAPGSRPGSLADEVLKPDRLDFRNARPTSLMPYVSHNNNTQRDARSGGSTPDDVIDRFLAKQLLKISEYEPDSEKDQSAAILERYFDRFGHGRGSTNGSSSSRRYGFLGNDSRDRDESRLGGSTNGISPSVRSLLRPDADEFLTSSTLRPSTVSELLGLPRGGDSPAELENARKAHEEQIEKFKNIINLQPAVKDFAGPPPAGLNPSFVPGNPTPGLVAQDPFKPAATAPAAPTFAFPTSPNLPTGPGVPLAMGQFDNPAPPPRPHVVRAPPPDSVFSLPQRRF